MYFSFLKKYFQTSCYLGILAISFLQIPAYAQVMEDGTLPTRVQTTDNLNFTIDSINNTNRAGNNLFHSFKEFSIPTGGSAIFNNSTDVVNIINRVTGGNISDIDGLIKANGSANLFLINPAGIVFGKNASLDIGGSFFGSTAESIKFSDDIEFSAIDITKPPLLSINVPLGLQMGSNPAAIEVKGEGYITNSDDIDTFSPFIFTNTNGLRVKEGNTLALIGGEVSFNGGIVAADSGKIEIAGINSGLINLNESLQGWTLDYKNADNFSDIKLDSQTLIDASGTGSGYIQLQGKNILIDGGSKVFVQSRGITGGGEIKASATDSIKVEGLNSNNKIASAFLTTTLGTANAAQINISVPHLVVSQTRGIISETFGQGKGGNININTSKLLQLDINSKPFTGETTNIAALSFSNGKAGDINIYTNKLSIFGRNISSANLAVGDGGNVYVFAEDIEVINGGGIASATLGTGNAGDVTIDAKSINLMGIDFQTFNPSNLSAVTLGIGNAGNLIVNTESLVLKDGGRVDSSTLAFGNSGSVTINASDFVEVSGTVPGSINPSLIISGANITDETFRQFVGLPDVPSGDSGNVNINTPLLKVSDGAEITVKNDGAGKGGILNINANSIQLNSKGKITASTQSGTGGNIDLQVKDGLILRNQSLISAESFGTGDGGNIEINSPVIVGLEDSDIIANAVQGNGGNINIDTSGLFGLQFRDELTTDSDITASSQFGVNGTVEINNPAIDPSSSLIQLPTEVVDSSQKIADGCSVNQGNSFTFIGKGGVAANPADTIIDLTLWNDLRDLNDSNVAKKISSQVKNHSSQPIVEATGWVVDKQGNVEFVAQTANRDNLQKTISCQGKVENI
ncbi:MAG: filamentous hemagglutinin N-terminal domain-containing protein [Cyanobacteria bacterium J06573_2]